MAHYYRVELTRRVACPDYGGSAYRLDTKRHTIPFGKAHDIKTGVEAERAAVSYAMQHLDDACDVSIWRLTGAGNGKGRYLKEDVNQRFHAGFDA